MRKLTLFAALLFSSTLSFAQKGLEVGISFTPASPGILNDEDFAVGDDLNFRGTFGFNTGLTLGYNFTDAVGLHTGIQLSRQGQNYINYNSAPEKADMDVFSRRLGYIRVPVLLKFNGDPSASSMAYFRIGPHFDILNSAKYKYDSKYSGTLSQLSNYDKEIDLKNYSVNNVKKEIYKSLVVGMTLEMGGAVNMTDELKLVFMLHLSGSLTNPEGENSGDSLFSQSYANQNSILPYAGTFNPFPATPGANRQTAWSVMGGLTVGFHYVLGF
jgi:hypothetical protein